ncbi:cathepsin L [Eupeodes corollae]|uniref:cathepsin L n=1 Tax=Eupeodes corollae TaxID=290404 RepID=UPI002493636E|nr:cathepsin L [Eupeodes corollae]
MRVLIALVGLIAATSAVSFVDIVKEEWQTFKLSHSKKYNTDVEEKFRLKIFMENKHKIAKHNQKYAQGLVGYKLGVNKYADLLHHEFVNVMNGFNRSASTSQGLNGIFKDSGVTFISPANVKLPKLVDWRESGAVTPVKDQGHCGSCWSFSATGALEGQHFRKTGVLISLSEQNLVDCSTKYGNNGCNGGLMDQAFSYIKDNGGIDTEMAYPYEGIDDSCHFDKKNIGATDKGFVDIPVGDEVKLMEAIATVGPVSVAIDASHESFQFYQEGVYDEPTCSSEELDHGVLAVGYGTEEDGSDYWLVKNSWGTTWGDKGYIKMSRNKDNQCGIASSASYPQV